MSKSRKMPSFAAMQERFKKLESGNTNTNYGNTYPFWNMQDNESAVVRILPDNDPENIDIFFKNKFTHTISISGKDVRINCPWTHGDECPLCKLSQKYYKDGDKKKGKYYYRQKNSLVRALVIDDPLPNDEETGENFTGKVVNAQFGYQIMEKIMHSIVTDFDEDENPFDIEHGTNFVIAKTRPKGAEYSKYDLASNFERKPSKIPKEYRDDIELVELHTLLPQCKDYGELENMLYAHLNDEEYDENQDNDSDDSTDSGSESKKSKKDKKKSKKDKKKSKKDKKKSKKYDTYDDDDNEGEDSEDEDSDDNEDEDSDDTSYDSVLDSIRKRKGK